MPEVNESQEIILNRIYENMEVMTKIRKSSDLIEQISELIINCFKNGNKIILCGNGGSAADAQHIAAELIGKFYKSDRIALPALALNTNTSTITSISNDIGYNEVFKRQIEAFGKERDILICISTSGNSKNLVEAVNMAKEKNIKTISITGKTGGRIGKISDVTLRVPSTNTPIIQNAQISIFHIICELVERQF